MNTNTTGSVFVTGGTGVIGSRICDTLGIKLPLPRFELLENIASQKLLLKGYDTVVHCAAMASSRKIARATVMSTNVEGTRRLAEAAREAGIAKFLFLSSAKVFGETTLAGTPFTDKTPFNPGSVYAESKVLAEEMLMAMHTPREFEVIILRPSVVVSDSAKGAVAMISSLASKGLPFPVIRPDSMRSFLSIDNLCSAVRLAMEHPNSPGKAFLVSDGMPISTKMFYEVLTESFGRHSLPFRVPNSVTRIVAEAIGINSIWQRLFGNFEVDSSRIMNELGWSPTYTTEDYLRATFSIKGASNLTD